MPVTCQARPRVADRRQRPNRSQGFIARGAGLPHRHPVDGRIRSAACRRRGGTRRDASMTSGSRSCLSPRTPTSRYCAKRPPRYRVATSSSRSGHHSCTRRFASLSSAARARDVMVQARRCGPSPAGAARSCPVSMRLLPSACGSCFGSCCCPTCCQQTCCRPRGQPA
jgi:hypothetical protein